MSSRTEASGQATLEARVSEAQRRAGMIVMAIIVSIAMADLIGLLALLAGFFGGDQNDVARFGVVAIAVALYNYPRLRSWQRAAEYFAETVPGSND